MNFVVHNEALIELMRMGHRHPDTGAWCASAGKYHFFIFYDPNKKTYSASYKSFPFHKPPTFIGCEIHPETKLPYFHTLEEAKFACDAAALELGADASMMKPNSKH